MEAGFSEGEMIGDRRCHQSSPIIAPIRAVLFATFDYFQKNLAGNGSDAFLGNRGILTFGILRLPRNVPC